MSGDIVAETVRLRLSRLTPGDAPFILELLNDPDFLRFIGDRGVRNPDDAVAYIQNGPAASYQRHGFGLYLVTVRESAVPAGICGLLRRDTLDDADIGFAFLPAFRGQGYALEAAAAVMRHAERDFGLARVVAIVSPGNQASRRLLERLGFRFERLIRLGEETAEVELFGTPPA